MKTCTKCGEEKPLSEFWKTSKAKDGLNWVCKACGKAANAAFHKSNPVYSKEYAAAYNLANKGKIQARNKAKYERMKAADLEKLKERQLAAYLKGREKTLARMREQRRENPEKFKEKARSRYAKHREIILTRSRIFHKNNLSKYLFSGAKRRARLCGCDFSIVLDDVKIPETCPVLGISLSPGDGKPGPNSPTLDRTDPAKGYVPGNVAVISFLANTIKQNVTDAAVFRRVADYIEAAMSAMA